MLCRPQRWVEPSWKNATRPASVTIRAGRRPPPSANGKKCYGKRPFYPPFICRNNIKKSTYLNSQIHLPLRSSLIFFYVFFLFFATHYHTILCFCVFFCNPNCSSLCRSRTLAAPPHCVCVRHAPKKCKRANAHTWRAPLTWAVSHATELTTARALPPRVREWCVW